MTEPMLNSLDLEGRPQDTRAITGARQPVLLGTVAHPSAVE